MPHMGNGSEYQGCEPQDLTDNGICTQCGECCTNLLPISDSDIRRIRHYIKRHGIRPINHIPVLIQGPTLDMVCPFLDDKKPDHKCLIYPVRPTICRHFTCHTYVNKDARDAMIEQIAQDHDTAKELAMSRTRDIRATFYPNTNKKGGNA